MSSKIASVESKRISPRPEVPPPPQTSTEKLNASSLSIMYIILVHDQPTMLSRIISALDEFQHTFVIRVDKRVHLLQPAASNDWFFSFKTVPILGESYFSNRGRYCGEQFAPECVRGARRLSSVSELGRLFYSESYHDWCVVTNAPIFVLVPFIVPRGADCCMLSLFGRAMGGLDDQATLRLRDQPERHNVPDKV